MLKRRFVLTVLLFAALTALLVDSCGSPKVRTSRSAIVGSNYDFVHEHWKEEKLARLYRVENLSLLEGKTRSETFLNACEWTHEQWESGVPDPYPLCNALDILQNIRSGETGGFCGQYAYVLADVLKALGFFSVRYVELSRNDGKGHFVVEVWSDDHARWTVLDPHKNIYYRFRDSDVPAGAGDIRASLYGGRPVEAVPADGGESADPGGLREYYANFAVSLRSDLMRHTEPLTIQDRRDMFLFFRDENTSIDIPYRNVTERYEDAYYDCNCVRAEFERGGDYVDFMFFTDGSMAHFDTFVLKQEGDEEWKVCPQKMRVPESDGVEKFYVAAANKHRRTGVPLEISIDW